MPYPLYYCPGPSEQLLTTFPAWCPHFNNQRHRPIDPKSSRGPGLLYKKDSISCSHHLYLLLSLLLEAPGNWVCSAFPGISTAEQNHLSHGRGPHGQTVSRLLLPVVQRQLPSGPSQHMAWDVGGPSLAQGDWYLSCSFDFRAGLVLIKLVWKSLGDTAEKLTVFTNT